MGTYDSYTPEEVVERIWVQEFKKMMEDRQSQNPTFSLQQVDLPSSILQTELPSYVYCYVEGIKDNPYAKLNGQVCELWKANEGPIPVLKKKELDKTTNLWLKNENTGRFIEKEYKLPQGSKAILTTENIGVTLEENYEGFDYIDMYTNPNTQTIYRIYAIPEQYLHLVNNTALVLAFSRNKNTRSYYTGIEVAFENGYRMCLQVVDYPLKGANKSAQRVLAVKPNADYQQEYREILRYWVARHIMFNPQDCQLEYVHSAGTGELKNFVENMAFGKMPQFNEYSAVQTTHIGEKTETDGGADWEQTSVSQDDDDFLTDFVQD